MAVPSITVTYGGSGGTAVVAPKINQDGYQTEYFKKSSTGDTQVRVRHLSETVKAGALPVDRHIVSIRQSEYPTADNPQGFVREAILTIRNQTNDTETAMVDIGEAMAYLANSSFLAGLFNKQGEF